MRRSARWWALTISLVLVAGCAEEALTPALDALEETTAEQETALVAAMEGIATQLGLGPDGTMGAMDESDEAPAFGNAVFADAFAVGDDHEVDTDLATDPTISDLPPDQLRMYNVMALWGRVRPNPNTEWSPLQWDPGLQVKEGDGVRVRRTILFEPGDMVHPQEARNLVTMTSRTGPHVDGVVAQVAIRTGPSVSTDVVSATDEAAFLAFRSTPYSVKIPANELPGLNFAEVIDDTGNGLILTALRRPTPGCAVGFMAGRWMRTSDRGGVFGGAWHQANGRREGYVVGRWGVTAAGERVFHGKIVNLQGQFLARMAGNYEDGQYKGEMYGRGGALLGYVHGRYMGEDGHGVFQGAWRQACVTDPPPRTCQLTSDGIRVCDDVVRPDPID